MKEALELATAQPTEENGNGLRMLEVQFLHDR